MSDEGWTIGDVCRPLIEVQNPVTKAVIPSASAPDVTVVAPDGSSTTVSAVHDDEVAGAWTTPVELTEVGTYTFIVESQPPYKDVQRCALYANPVS